MDRIEEVKSQLKNLEEESRRLKNELEKLEGLNKNYNDKFFQALKENNPGMWYRWTYTGNDFYHLTGFVGSYHELSPVTRYMFEIDRRISVLNNGEQVMITVVSEENKFSFDEGEFIPVDIEEIRDVMMKVQEKQLNKISNL